MPSISPHLFSNTTLLFLPRPCRRHHCHGRSRLTQSQVLASSLLSLRDSRRHRARADIVTGERYNMPLYFLEHRESPPRDTAFMVSAASALPAAPCLRAVDFPRHHAARSRDADFFSTSAIYASQGSSLLLSMNISREHQVLYHAIIFMLTARYSIRHDRFMISRIDSSVLCRYSYFSPA